jgi:hypothetical protein
MAAPVTAAQETSIEDMYVGDAVEPNEAAASDEDGAWDDGETEEYADSSDEMDDSSRPTEQAADDAEFKEDSEETMETTWDETNTAVPSAESPEDWPAHEYDYKYGGAPYHCESYEPSYSEPSYSEPVQAWEDADVEVVEGEDSEDAVPATPSAETVEYDSEIILSLARTLDRVGSTLHCLSQYLTEMATADLAKRHGETIER